MKKTFTTILIFLVILFITYMILTQQALSDNKSTRAKTDLNPIGYDQTSNNYIGPEEEDPLYSEPDIFLRKLNQQKLPPLSQKEKIIWSFRLAKTNPFL